MRKVFLVVLMALCLPIVLPSTAAFAQNEAQYREIFGNVRDRHGSPVKGANVQIENDDTHSVQSYLTDADGSFHFKRLSRDTDYEVSASFNGATSKKVSVSKFDDKASKFVKLVIEDR